MKMEPSGGEIQGQTNPTICAKCTHFINITVPVCGPVLPYGRWCRAEQIGMDFVYGTPHYAACEDKNKGDCPDYEPQLGVLTAPAPEVPPARRSIWRFLDMR